MTIQCPKCGGPMRVLAGCSAHEDNWYCEDEKGCGYEAWTQDEEESSRSPACYGAWTHVDDAMPDEDQRVITYCGDFGEKHGDYYWLMDCTVFRSGRFQVVERYRITHWMPAPDAP